MFSVVDVGASELHVTKGYLQIKIGAVWEKRAFSTHLGFSELIILPFRLSNASRMLQCLVEWNLWWHF